MSLLVRLAAVGLIATGCGVSNPQLHAGVSSPASSVRITVPTPSPGTPACVLLAACPSQLPVGGLAFDTDRSTLVLFGGYSAAGRVLNETWEWNAATEWNQLHPATIPAARGMTAMVYDRARHVVLMYGGRDTVGGTVPCGELDQWFCSPDTWTWDGENWTPLHPVKSPPPFVPTITYDESSNVALLYNYLGGPGTWSWDGATWTLKASGSSGSPDPARGTPVMAFDYATGHVVMFEGFSYSGGNVSTMWSWTGQGWKSLGIDAPFPRLGAAAAADIDRQSLVGYLGPRVLAPDPPGVNALPAQTWAWDGVQWTQLHPLHEPTAFAAALFADPKNHKTLLVGTNFRQGNAIEIWAWNGDDWKRLS
jgi:Galactose oxidase, central domain